jgi:hypothetical protein
VTLVASKSVRSYLAANSILKPTCLSGTTVNENRRTMKRLNLFSTVIITILFLPVFRSNAQQTNLLPDGAKYIGAMKDGKPNGRGTLIETNGDVYTGEVRDGSANGQGTGVSSNGAVKKGEWKGEWRNGNLYRGTGTVVLVDGTKEIGTWNSDGTKSGGRIIWKDGRQYVGGWKIIDGASELPDGQGKMTHPDGKIEEGLWKDGKFMGTEKSP